MPLVFDYDTTESEFTLEELAQLLDVPAFVIRRQHGYDQDIPDNLDDM